MNSAAPTLVDAYQAIDQALYETGMVLAPVKKREAARALLSWERFNL